MSFNFREDTPSDVLAAFSALAQPLPDDAWWGPAPELPQPVSEVHEWWSPDWREAGIEDEFESEPWRHDWARWLSGSMRSWPGAVFVFLEWLGPFIETYQQDRPQLVGYVLYDVQPRPHLLWARDGKLAMEDLNVPAPTSPS